MHHLTQFQMFLNQFEYLTGHFMKLHICMMENRSNAETLHMLQTVAGSSEKMLLLFETYMREYIYTLTDTLPDDENGGALTCSNLHTIKKGTPVVPPSGLPKIIDFLEELSKISGSKPVK